MEEEIRAFLEICRCGSISKAADRLFISQSSLSTRIRILERKLGYSLLVRGKGQRSVVLTDKGRKFHSLAVKYQDLVRQMMALADEQEQMTLRVSSVNSVGTYLFTQVYEHFMAENPEVSLQVQEAEVDLAYAKLEKGETDIAFSPEKRSSSLVAVRPAFSEPMVFVCSDNSSFTDPVAVRILNTENEIYVGWSSEFEAWHDRIFGEYQKPRMALSIMSHLQFFLQKKGCWALVPASVGRGLTEAGGIRHCRTSFPVPARTTNFLCLDKNLGNRQVTLFLQCLKQTLDQMENVDFGIYI